MMTAKLPLLPLALAGLLAFPAAATAQAQASDEHGAHHPETGQAAAPAATAAVQDLRQAMRARMAEIRTTQDPERRRQLLEAQMKDMEALLEAGGYPYPGGGMMGGRGGPGMMGHGMHGVRQGGMQHGMEGRGMHSGMRCDMGGGSMRHGMAGQMPAGAGDATARRLDALEKRLDLLQMLWQQQLR